jgi:HK97 family phage prohead protease
MYLHRPHSYEGVMMARNSDNPEVQRKLRARKKALAETADALTHAGVDWESSEHILTFYAARFMSRPDKVGDIIHPDAFNEWYSRWKADPEKEYGNTQGRLPVVISHQWDSFGSVIGWARPEDVTITAEGLLVSAHLFPNSPDAQKAWEVARDLGLGASFAFDVKREHRRSDGVNVLDNFAEILEVGPTLFGAEPGAGTRSVKDYDRVLLEFKSLQADVLEHHGARILGRELADIERKTQERRQAKAGAAPGTGPRCLNCGAFLSARHGAQVEVDLGDGVFRPQGHVEWVQCTNCFNLDIYDPTLKVIPDQATANWFAKAITEQIIENAVADEAIQLVDRRDAVLLKAAAKSGIDQARADRHARDLAMMEDTLAATAQKKLDRARIEADLDELEAAIHGDKPAPNVEVDIAAIDRRNRAATKGLYGG